MDAKQPVNPLDDVTLDREIQAALDVDPSPDFLVRVRLRVANKTRIQPWFPLPLQGLALVAIAVGVVVFLLRSEEDPKKPIQMTSKAVGPVEAVPLPRQAAPASVAQAYGRAETGPYVPKQAGQRPVVILPSEEVEAFRQLAAAITEGHLALAETDHVEAASVASRDVVMNEDGIPVPAALNIEPLGIDSITQ